MDAYWKGGTTNTAGALNLMRNEMYNSNNGDRSDKPNVALVITDGKSNDRQRTLTNAREAR